MKRIGVIEGISLHLGDVVVADDILTVRLYASGPLVDARAQVWHEAVDVSLARTRAPGAREPLQFPEHPGNEVLISIPPRVTVDGKPLSLVRGNAVVISGIDSPWESSWRFRVPEVLSGDSRVVVQVPATGRGADDPAYVASWSDLA